MVRKGVALSRMTKIFLMCLSAAEIDIALAGNENPALMDSISFSLRTMGLHFKF